MARAPRKSTTKKSPAKRSARREKPTVDASAESAPEQERTSRGTFAPGNRAGFKPGESGNAGRRYTFVPMMRDLLEAPINDRSQLSNIEAIVLALIKKALKGDVKAAQLLFERVEGKARQASEIPVDPREALAKLLGVGVEQLPE